MSEEKAATEVLDDEQPTLDDDKNKIVTNQDEVDAYNIVKAILRQTLDVKRVAMKDTITYCGVLLDNNVRKPLCRFYFNNPAKKYLATFDVDKKEMKHPIAELDEIYGFTDTLIATAEKYIQGTNASIERYDDSTE